MGKLGFTRDPVQLKKPLVARCLWLLSLCCPFPMRGAGVPRGCGRYWFELIEFSGSLLVIR